jgi:hypothetical protein
LTANKCKHCDLRFCKSSGEWTKCVLHPSVKETELKVTVLTSSHAGTCPVVRRNRGPHLGVGRVGASLDKLGQSSV